MSQEMGFGLQEKEVKMNEILATCYSEKEKNDVLNTQGRVLEEEKMRLQDEEEKLMAIAGEVRGRFDDDSAFERPFRSRCESVEFHTHMLL